MYEVYTRKGNIVHLGQDYVCDGSNPILSGARIQTHVHTDHMCEWENSLMSVVYLTQETHELLLAESSNENALKYRSNIKVVPADGEWNTPTNGTASRFRLLKSGHMIGSVMVSVQNTRLNKTYLYTSDFAWPLPEDTEKKLSKMSHDILVIDATYGSPSQSVREYSQAEVQRCLVDIVKQNMEEKTVRIVGQRGRLQSAYAVLASELEKAKPEYYGSKSVDKTISVYHNAFGMNGNSTYKGIIGSVKGSNVPQIHLVDTRDQGILEGQNPNEVMVRLMETRSLDQMCAQTSKGYQISFTNHANFHGTLDLIKLVKPRSGVLTVGTYSHELAQYVRNNLGIEACCAVMR